MINVLRSEWIKLRTVRMNWILGIIAFAFPLIITLLTAFFEGDSRSFDAHELLDTLIGTAFVSSVLCGVIAAASITSEFGFGTIRATFAAVPKRLRVIVAKGIIVVVAAMVLVAIVIVVGLLVGRSLAEGQGATIDLDGIPSAKPALAGAVVFAGMMAVAGYGLGLMMRSTPAAISILIVWPLIAEPLVGGLIEKISGWGNVIGWMPFRSGFRIWFVEPEFVNDPSRLVSGLYFGAVVLALAAIGAFAVNRRDA